jgi:c-di-GMP-binding flagellar brake protein YcgR
MIERTPERPDLPLSPLRALIPGCIILVEFEGLCGRYPCTLADLTLEGELVVQVPHSVTIRHPLRPGDTVVVRGAFDGTLYGFRTQVKQHVFRPQPVMVLARPTDVGMQRLRRNDRVPCLIPATATVGGQRLSGMIIDLSRGGCRFLCETAADPPEPIAEETEITLCFPLFRMGEQQTATGTLRSATAADGTLRLGVEFGELAASVIATIETYIAGLIDLVEEEAA